MQEVKESDLARRVLRPEVDMETNLLVAMGPFSLLGGRLVPALKFSRVDRILILGKFEANRKILLNKIKTALKFLIINNLSVRPSVTRITHLI